MSLPAVNRLSLKSDSDRFFRSGRNLHSPYLQLVVLSEKTQNPLFAILISKKVAKKAHSRNRLRRQLSALIQSQLPNFPPQKYLFIFKKSTSSLTHTDIKDSFLKLSSSL